MTACVWVGYADTTTPMTTLYNGGPVMGGTFPALIWASVMSAWEEIKAERDSGSEGRQASRLVFGLRLDLHTAVVNSETEVEPSEPEAAEPSEPVHLKRPNPNRPNQRNRANRRSPLLEAALPRGRPIPAGVPLNFFGVVWLGWPPKRSTKKYKTLHPYRDGSCARIGFEMWGLPAAQKRQGRSTALVMPIRGPVTTSPRQPWLGRQQ